MRTLIIILGIVAVVTAAACARDTAATSPARPTVIAPPPPVAPGPRPPAPAGPAWPAIDHEPQLGILLHRGPEVVCRLLLPCTLSDGTELPAGPLAVRAAGDGFQVAGRRIPGPRATLTPRGSGPVVSIGSGKDADRFAGSLLLARNRGDVELIERVGMEDWLEGVLPAEMNPNWPVEALVAQAIAARSYAAARWQTRHDEDWQLVRGTADVAYDGAVEPSANVAEALGRSRGLILVHAGQAILARFHAASGGRTEASDVLWPGATLVDGATPLARFMAPVEDPASARGAQGLGWTKTHQDWRTAIPLADITARLRTWAEAVPSRPRIGTVRSVRIAETRPSGRVAAVTIVHRTAAGEREDRIDATEFRLAVGAVRIRSLWWERCAMAGGQLAIDGHGFGHGVGLPQVSAWALANEHVRGEDIIARYYPGAVLSRAWR